MFFLSNFHTFCVISFSDGVNLGTYCVIFCTFVEINSLVRYFLPPKLLDHDFFCDKFHISAYVTDPYNLLLRAFGNGIFDNGKYFSLKDNVFLIIILQQNMRGICCQKSFSFKVHLAFAKHVHQNVTTRMDRSVTLLFGKYQRGLSPDLMAYIQRLKITTFPRCESWRLA